MVYYPPRYLFRRHEILRHLRRGERFLEVGGGSLLLARELAAFFQSGTVLEPAPAAEKLWQELPQEIRNRLELRSDTLEQFQDLHGFDGIICCEVLEHVPDDQAFIHRLYALLKPQGQLILSVPAGMRHWSVHDELAGHVRRYEREALSLLLANARFHTQQLVSYGYPFVNWLHRPRQWHAQRHQDRLQDQSLMARSIRSGIDQVSGFPSWLGFFINPVTAWPLCRLAALFNHFHLSDSYLVIAQK
ncbi:MAG: class I SAM-dependent methyltransferase [Magnetococcales bacterium]|nr:class I SAM-dependent methyltransferase [Magnetococcales bacterium]